MTEENERKKFLLSASSGRLMVSLSLPAIVGMVVIGLSLSSMLSMRGSSSAPTPWARYPSLIRSHSSTQASLA